MATKPINFAGSQADYERYKATEADRMAYNTATFDQRQQAKSNGDYWGGYQDQSNSGSRYGNSYGSGSGIISGRPNESEAERASRLAMEQAINQNVANLQAQKGSLGNQYAAAAQQAYANYELSKRQLPGLVGGYASGTADSLIANSMMEYQNSQNALQQQKADALKQIDLDINNVRSTGNIEIAKNAEKYALLAQQQAEAERLRQEQLRQQAINNARSASNAGFDNDLALAKALAANGDFSGYAKLGATQQQINAMRNDYQQINKLDAGDAGDSTQRLIAYYRQQGYTDSQIANILNSMN